MKQEPNSFSENYNRLNEINEAKKIPQVGNFGKVYTEFKGNYKGALEKLKAEEDGEAIGALKHEKLGDIDLVWGKAGTGESNGYGLSKLIEFHPEVVDDLDKIIYSLPIKSQSENRVILESEKYRAIISQEYLGEKKEWLLNAFEFKNESGSADFIDPTQILDKREKIALSAADKDIIPQNSEKPFSETVKAYKNLKNDGLSEKEAELGKLGEWSKVIKSAKLRGDIKAKQAEIKELKKKLEGRKGALQYKIKEIEKTQAPKSGIVEPTQELY
jgi:hypothetical protein